MTNKSFIEQELEKLQEKGTWYKYYTKNKDLILIFQKAMEEVDKRKFCVRCFYNLPHDMDVDESKTEIIHTYAIMLEEIEKVLGK